jgi:aminopeptidase N
MTRNVRAWLRAAVALLATMTLLGGTAASGAIDTTGAAGVGDRYFPHYGNGGYDVRHYAISVKYDVASQRLSGVTRVRSVAGQRLTRFNLDLVIRASSVSVDGRPARFTQGKHELVVTPRRPIISGERFTVRVRYAGVPGELRAGGLGAWFETPDGAIAAGEPEVATVWFPSNDHPSDKATYDIRIQTRRGTQAVSNGTLVERTRVGREVRWHWRVTEPMATYLATAVIGDYDLVRGTTAGGTPYLYAITEHLKGRMRRNAVRSLRQTPKVVDFFADRFGEYPFAITGGTLINASFGFSLENQTRPNYSKVFFYGENHEVIAHELAHMWWGDSVSVRRWRHIWLNEGFATWSSWLYLAHEPGAGFTLNDVFGDVYLRFSGYRPFWRLRLDDPGPRRLFDRAVYDRGAMALQALRNRIGAVAHDELLRRWASERQYDTGTVREFEALAEEVSGQDLAVFFDEWLHQRNQPRPSEELGFPPDLLPLGAARESGRVPESLLADPAQSLRSRT